MRRKLTSRRDQRRRASSSGSSLSQPQFLLSAAAMATPAIFLRRLTFDLAANSLSSVQLPENYRQDSLNQLLHLKPVVQLKRLSGSSYSHTRTTNSSSQQKQQRKQKGQPFSPEPYTPQVGDLVVYLRDAHAAWLQNRRNSNSATTNSSYIGEYLCGQDQPAVRKLVRVYSSRYWLSRVRPRNQLSSSSSWLLRLRLKVVGSSESQNKSDDINKDKSSAATFFDVVWPLSSDKDLPQFLVPLHVYNAAMQRRWQVGDKFRHCCCHDNQRVGAVLGFDRRRLASGWLCVRVRWEDCNDADVSEEFVSPWDMQPINQDDSSIATKTMRTGVSHQLMLDRLLACLLECRRPRWRRLFGAGTVGRRASFFSDAPCAQFKSAVDFPLTVSMVTKRLRTGFYRHPLATLYDLAALLANYRRRWRLAYRSRDVEATAEAAANVKRAGLLCDAVALCCQADPPAPDEALRSLLVLPGRECLLSCVSDAVV